MRQPEETLADLSYLLESAQILQLGLAETKDFNMAAPVYFKAIKNILKDACVDIEIEFEELNFDAVYYTIQFLIHRVSEQM